jgi:prepilin-type N-terminal cleavage/methylation domain-containing protein
MACRRSAYTLFELILVLALLALLAALALPSLQAMYGDYRVRAATDQLRAAWAAARAHAMDEGLAYRFAIVPGGANYRVAPDTPAYWTGGGDAPASADPDNPPLVLEEALPKGVRFSTDSSTLGGSDLADDTLPAVAEASPGDWTPLTVFLPDGTARDDVSIIFQGRGARPMALTLRALTGVVTAKFADAGANRNSTRGLQ